MQNWIELGVGLIATVSVVAVAIEGLRIFASWRRGGNGTTNA